MLDRDLKTFTECFTLYYEFPAYVKHNFLR